ncbi:amidohydrolase [Halpernia frigidisoli]|uniref:Omega-amidase YafV n=1 Tax=Halpernia frigidisoli TaxID=1125876 RepID=A0A1I3HR05_9FLAO|nr:amidohydrolase [Halpernia frigidisoli]SFI38164.1 Predicted amidohydrolase [Halpernia frigidisoli]
MNNLKIKALEFDISWKDKEANFHQIEKLLENENADLFLLPEMFSTGFCMDAEEIADQSDQSLNWLKNIANKKEAAFSGSASVQENGKFYNRMYFVKPNGEVDFYDKRHLFSYSGEDKIYSKGDSRKIINFKGFRILLQVCYDLRFPVFSRNKNDFDLILYVSNWPESRISAWETLLKARAIENQSFVFGLNRIGIDGNNLKYPESSSYCFDAEGKIISNVLNQIISVDLDLNDLQNFRQKFPFLKDGDDFELKF